ncbi:MAG: PmoA family protein [Planctomycetaceae bacterium]
MIPCLRPSRSVLIASLAAAVFAARGTSAEVRFERLDDRVAVSIDGKPFTAYVFQGHPKPILFPLIGPTESGLTRQYPVVEGVAGEAKDHPHHESFWFTHGSVNGHDFWASHPLAAKAESRAGPRIEHGSIVRTEAGAPGVLEATARWLAGDGRVVCTDTRRLVFGGGAGVRTIDHSITIHADHGPVTFGDTKEGTFALRVHPALQPTDANGSTGATGRIVNAAGDVDGAAWGKAARWVDYSGTVDGRAVGVAILDHPANLRHPTYWHAREYGLFAANPFGVNDFTKAAPGAGAHTIPSGGALTFRHLVVLHEGDEAAADIDARWRAWSAAADAVPQAAP